MGLYFRADTIKCSIEANNLEESLRGISWKKFFASKLTSKRIKLDYRVNKYKYAGLLLEKYEAGFYAIY